MSWTRHCNVPLIHPLRYHLAVTTVIGDSRNTLLYVATASKWYLPLTRANSGPRFQPLLEHLCHIYPGSNEGPCREVMQSASTASFVCLCVNHLVCLHCLTWQSVSGFVDNNLTLDNRCLLQWMCWALWLGTIICPHSVRPLRYNAILMNLSAYAMQPSHITTVSYCCVCLQL